VSGFQMVSHLVLAAILLKPFENRTNLPVFEWFCHFVKTIENRTKKSSGFRMVLSKTGPFDNRTKIEFENKTWSGIRMLTAQAIQKPDKLVWFSNGYNKMANHLKTGPIGSVFKQSKARPFCLKKFFLTLFVIKQSRLVNHSKTGQIL
jgi:hypothetical protein